ncbi:MAG: cation diffusion facilitator family transporter [Desulfuromonadales bacterium]
MRETSEKVAVLSILTNLLLLGFKWILAVLSGSLAIKADAVHSLTDVVSSIVILIGIRISRRTSQQFPYGLYKIENLVALGVSVLIFLAGYEIFMEAFTASGQQLPRHVTLAVTGILLTMVISWAFARYELAKGKETGSPSLVADAQDFSTDILSSLVILFSLLGSAAGWNIDRYAALVVAFFVIRSAFTIFLDAVRVLLDASLDGGSLERIRQIVAADPHTASINELRARNAGRYKFIELDLTLHIKDLEKGHNVVEGLKQRLKEELENVDHVLIHFESEEKRHRTLAVPLREDRRLLSEHFGEAPFFRLLRINARDGQVTEDSVVRNPYAREEKAKGIQVANWLLKEGLDLLLLKNGLGQKGPAIVLANAGVETVVVAGEDAEEAFREGVQRLQHGG